MKTIVIVGIESSFGDEPRIIQVIRGLHGTCRIIGIGPGKPHPKLEEFYRVESPSDLYGKIFDLLTRVLKYYFPAILRFRYRSIIDIIEDLNPDQIWIQHFESGVLVRNLPQTKIFNSHEYIPLQNNGSILWRMTKQVMIKRELKKILSAVDVLIVESDAVKRAYQEYEPALNDIRIIPNTREFHPEISYREPHQSQIRLVHHGIAAPSRGLELIIDAVGTADPRFSLHLYLIQSKRNRDYLNSLKRYAAKYENVTIMEPIPYSMLVNEMNRYDLGLCVFRSNNYHTMYTTVPSKFWEYIAAGVVPVAWSGSAMAEVLKENHIGMLCEDLEIETLKNLLNSINHDELCEMKRKVHSIREKFSSEKTIDPVLSDLLEYPKN